MSGYLENVAADRAPDIDPADELRSWRRVADQMRRQLLAVQDLHWPEDVGTHRVCKTCRDDGGERLSHPCQTWRAIATRPGVQESS